MPPLRASRTTRFCRNCVSWQEEQFDHGVYSSTQSSGVVVVVVAVLVEVLVVVVLVEVLVVVVVVVVVMHLKRCSVVSKLKLLSAV